jgi:sortase B
MDYVNMNPLGEYSLTGSIFLDSDNASDFSDFNSILYGHNMMPEVMFGNVKEYRSETYFDSHRYGMLYYGGRAYGLNIFAMIEADAYDDSVYRPGVPEGEESSYLETLLERALVDRSGDIGGVQAEAEAEAQAGLDSIDWGEERILLLSTCTAGLTNGRYLLIARISEETYENPYLTEGGEGSLGAGQLLLYGIGILALAGLVLILLLLRRRRRRRAAAESRD